MSEQPDVVADLGDLVEHDEHLLGMQPIEFDCPWCKQLVVLMEDSIAHHEPQCAAFAELDPLEFLVQGRERAVHPRVLA